MKTRSPPERRASSGKGEPNRLVPLVVEAVFRLGIIGDGLAILALRPKVEVRIVGSGTGPIQVFVFPGIDDFGVRSLAFDPALLVPFRVQIREVDLLRRILLTIVIERLVEEIALIFARGTG